MTEYSRYLRRTRALPSVRQRKALNLLRDGIVLLHDDVVSVVGRATVRACLHHEWFKEEVDGRGDTVVCITPAGRRALAAGPPDAQIAYAQIA